MLAFGNHRPRDVPWIHDWRFLLSNTIDEARLSKLKIMPWGEARKNGKINMLTRNKHRFFKHSLGMSENDQKLPSKVSIYIPKAKRAAYKELVDHSDMTVSELFIEALLGKGKHDPEMKKIGAKLIAEGAAIKTEIKSQNLMSDDIARELKLIRTIGMTLMGRRS